MGYWGIRTLACFCEPKFTVRDTQQLGPKITDRYHHMHEVAGNQSELKRDVCDFIVEIRKENGQQYPSTSLYDLLQGLSMYLEREHNF